LPDIANYLQSIYIWYIYINKSVPIQTIEEYVWENEIKESYPLRQLVAELRKKFNTGQNFIFADKGIGYRFEIKR